jgi:hypothetical protein
MVLLLWLGSSGAYVGKGVFLEKNEKGKRHMASRSTLGHLSPESSVAQ